MTKFDYNFRFTMPPSLQRFLRRYKIMRIFGVHLAKK